MTEYLTVLSKRTNVTRLLNKNDFFLKKKINNKRIIWPPIKITIFSLSTSSISSLWGALYSSCWMLDLLFRTKVDRGYLLQFQNVQR